jgi:hypothetical protein
LEIKDGSAKKKAKRPQEYEKNGFARSEAEGGWENCLGDTPGQFGWLSK